MSQKGFWDVPEETTGILKERTALTGKVESYQKLSTQLEDNKIMLDLALEEEDPGSQQRYSSTG